MAFVVPKEIADKVRQYTEAVDKSDRLMDELSDYFHKEMDGAYMDGFELVDKPAGKEQNEGEFCDQWTIYDEDAFCGNYYYPVEGGGYVRIGYRM